MNSMSNPRFNPDIFVRQRMQLPGGEEDFRFPKSGVYTSLQISLSPHAIDGLVKGLEANQRLILFLKNTEYNSHFKISFRATEAREV
uniref:Uncharacterized protein n=1 Tax=Oryza rufipogon TaxID=4529 RepID=A0A0E0RBR3_ORYRU